ncbi:hypothetical protein TcasGA2_TC002684 [Tribolium castaneum]|uniref:Uncharacterized protein n=1 Tax=Tribolium castaneum TaxID=7070 RepID=D6WEA1_TRICA|nr:hypothetical protein TcasGA2_TC002684 [Tribolium castaneum]
MSIIDSTETALWRMQAARQGPRPAIGAILNAKTNMKDAKNVPFARTEVVLLQINPN